MSSGVRSFARLGEWIVDVYALESAQRTADGLLRGCDFSWRA
jgi:hypothetical protein